MKTKLKNNLIQLGIIIGACFVSLQVYERIIIQQRLRDAFLSGAVYQKEYMRLYPEPSNEELWNNYLNGRTEVLRPENGDVLEEWGSNYIEAGTLVFTNGNWHWAGSSNVILRIIHDYQSMSK